MSIKINKENVRSGERLCGCTQEQSVELDYVLPDYYPEIFRIVRCIAEPRITACTAEEGRAVYELTVCLKIIYCSEEGKAPHVIDQKLTYNRTVNFDKACTNPAVYISAFSDHINCRAVNRRRIDVRGAVTMRISAWGENEAEAVTQVIGGDVQLKRKSVLCPSDILRSQKRLCISDEFEIGDMPPVGSVIRCNAVIVSRDKKLIGSKAAAKGELKLYILYVPQGEAEDGSELCTLTYSMPFSGLAELEGMDESYDCRISTEVIASDVKPCSEGDGEVKRLECDVIVLMECEAVRKTVCELACDEYSVLYDSSHECVPIKVCREPSETEGVIIVKGICENRDNPISVIYDAWCNADKLSSVIIDGKIVICGNVHMSVMGKTESGDFVICENDVPVEEDAMVFSGLEDRSISSDADVRMTFDNVSCDYTINSENGAEIKAEISVKGIVKDYETIDVITDITVDEQTPREKNDEYAVRLYFAESGEELWSIAKKYGASIERIAEENELEGDVLRESRMLLIPVA